MHNSRVFSLLSAPLHGFNPFRPIVSNMEMIKTIIPSIVKKALTVNVDMGLSIAFWREAEPANTNPNKKKL